MKIALAASEAVPFVKTGGLADVIGALPLELGALGHEIVVLLPLYGRVKRGPFSLGRIAVPSGTPFGLLSATPPGTRVRFVFVEHDDFFGFRDAPYADAHGDYGDNDRRFVFFSRACLRALEILDFRPDVLHAHDWQAAAAALFLRTHHGRDPFFRGTASVFTIHNLAYQGRFGGASFGLTELPDSYFRPESLEFHGDLCLLKAGIVYADVVSTVSPTYSLEIQTPEHGQGLDGLLRSRRGDLVGILNGIDTRIWNPESDPFIAQPFSAARPEGKEACRLALAGELAFERKELPIAGLVGRLVEQKGIDLVLEALPPILERAELNAVVLGSGERRFVEGAAGLARRFPGSFRAVTEFDDPLAHRIEAGADLFLMPSRFEPCGLNQMISMRYGTLPVVRPVGGLKDSVVPVARDTVEKGSANGFHVSEQSARSLRETIEWALLVRRDDPRSWRRVVAAAMSGDWSWGRSAHLYVAAFEAAIARRRAGLSSGEGDLEPANPVSFERGEPLPKDYGRDRLVGMRQSPDRLFAYWELAGPTGREFLSRVPPGDIRLRVENLSTGDAHDLAIAVEGGRHWIAVEPDCAYRLSIGHVAAGGEFVAVVVSGDVPRPRPGKRPARVRRVRRARASSPPRIVDATDAGGTASADDREGYSGRSGPERAGERGKPKPR